MAAPKNNQFWKNRSTHGRDKLFALAELLREASHEYFNYCDGHPWYKVEAIKSGDNAGKLVKIPTAIPYTLSGFCLYIGASESFWRNFRSNVNLGEDFLSVIEEIELTIKTQKFTGAAVGAFNANLMARDLGMVDKTEITGKDGQPLIPPVVLNAPQGLQIDLPSNTDGD